MKKLFYQGSCLIILGMFLLLSSCTKEEVETLTIGGNEIQVDHGMLHFKDFKAFSDLTEYLSADPSRVKEIEKSNFKSAEIAYEETNEQNMDKKPEDSKINTNVAYWKVLPDGEKQLTRIINHPAYRALFNESAFVEVGDQIFKLSQDKIYIFDSRYLDNAKTTESIETIPGVKVLIKTDYTALQKGCEVAATCDNVYATKNGKQYQKLNGSVDPEIQVIADPYTGVYCFCSTGRFIYGTDSYQRGFLGGWYAYKVSEIGVKAAVPYPDYNKSSVIFVGSGTCNSKHYVINGGYNECVN